MLLIIATLTSLPGSPTEGGWIEGKDLPPRLKYTYINVEERLFYLIDCSVDLLIDLEREMDVRLLQWCNLFFSFISGI